MSMHREVRMLMGKRSSSKARILELLRGVPLLEGCSKKELSLLADIADEVGFTDGDVICKEGDAGLGLQLIVDGEAKVEVGGKMRRKMGPGTFFGEVALLDGGPRSATVIANTDTTVLTVPAWSFQALLKQQPAIAVKMLPVLAHRLRTADQAPA